MEEKVTFAEGFGAGVLILVRKLVLTRLAFGITYSIFSKIGRRAETKFGKATNPALETFLM